MREAARAHDALAGRRTPRRRRSRHRRGIARPATRKTPPRRGWRGAPRAPWAVSASVPSPQPQRVAEGAVGIREAEEQVAMLVVGRADHDLAARQQHLDLVQGVVHQAVPERRGLDADPRRRAADGDGLELGHHRRHAAARQGPCDQVLVGRHALDVDPPGLRIRVDHVVQAAQVEPALAVVAAVAKQVGCALAQRDRRRRPARPPRNCAAACGDAVARGRAPQCPYRCARVIG